MLELEEEDSNPPACLGHQMHAAVHMHHHGSSDMLESNSNDFVYKFLHSIFHAICVFVA